MPALLSISLMHCANVEIREVTPGKDESQRNKRRHKYPLVRYQVLDVGPIRRILEAAGSGESDHGLRHALHLCRGHFKGLCARCAAVRAPHRSEPRAPQVRGKAEVGINVNDYRVSTPGLVGSAYRKATEQAPRSPIGGSSNDPDVVGAGLVEHNRTQNQIVGTVARLGRSPRSPVGDEPEFRRCLGAERHRLGV